MKVKKSKVKQVGIVLVVLLAAWFLWVVFSAPEYDDPLTPKPTQGNPDAAVQIVEFGDLQCPACRAAHFQLESIKQEFGDQIGFQFYHFPLRSIHPFAQKASEAAECANDQGQFYEYIDMVYRNQENIAQSDLKRYADRLGLDTELFNACLDSGSKRDIIEIDVREGLARDVQGTPTFFVNGQRIDNWQTDLRAAIVSRLPAEQ